MEESCLDERGSAEATINSSSVMMDGGGIGDGVVVGDVVGVGDGDGVGSCEVGMVFGSL